MRALALGLAGVLVATAMASGLGPTGPDLAAYDAQVALADKLIVLAAAPSHDALARAAALARATVTSAAGGAAAPPVPAFPTASDAARALLGRVGAEADLSALETLPPAVDEALTRVIGAYLAYDDATRAGLAGLDLERAAHARVVLGPREAAPPAPTADDLAFGAELRVRLAPGMAARVALVDAALQLRDALTAHPARIAPILAPPALALDLEGQPSLHEDNVALLIDAGGNDVYTNNAGGSNLKAPLCPVAPEEAPMYVSSALLDLGGDDVYGSEDAGCGLNGGGMFGAGFLLDAAGDDVYQGFGNAVNGGSVIGSGFLLDAEGADVYEGYFGGTNGGANIGLAALVDGAGDDAYEGVYVGINGGAGLGLGHLVDAGGHDRYEARSEFSNGGGIVGGRGFLLDTEGDDAYVTATSGFTGYAHNGGGFFGGAGFLLDASGNDLYATGDRASNGGASLGGRGLLWDRAGDDIYLAGGGGVNGGVGEVEGVLNLAVPVGTGLLLDEGGSDVFAETAGTCANPAPCTVVPKGTLGAQVDL